MVKIVYITLAFLMGGGLVLFGIGGGGALPGGLVDAITDPSAGDDGTQRLQDQEASATRRARANPTDAAAWAAVARARFSLASAGDNLDPNTGEFSEEGMAQLRAADRAWQEHIKLAGDNPDSRVASLMVQAYAGGLGEIDKAVQAQEIIAEQRESAGAYATLAQYAYAAGQLRKGDLARDKALELTEPDMREALKGQLESARAQAALQAGENASPTPTPTPTPGNDSEE